MSKKLVWCLLGYVSVWLSMIPSISVAQSEMSSGYTVMAIEAVVGGGSTFILAKNSPERLLLRSRSEVVQAAMLSAYLAGGRVNPDVYEATDVIRRVPAFERGGGQLGADTGLHIVSRIATQRDDRGMDHLEVFLKERRNGTEIQYNVFDSHLQRLLLAAHDHQGRHSDDQVSVQIGTSGKSLWSVRLGSR